MQPGRKSATQQTNDARCNDAVAYKCYANSVAHSSGACLLCTKYIARANEATSETKQRIFNARLTVSLNTCKRFADYLYTRKRRTHVWYDGCWMEHLCCALYNNYFASAAALRKWRWRIYADFCGEHHRVYCVYIICVRWHICKHPKEPPLQPSKTPQMPPMLRKANDKSLPSQKGEKQW